MHTSDCILISEYVVRTLELSKRSDVGACSPAVPHMRLGAFSLSKIAACDTTAISSRNVGRNLGQGLPSLSSRLRYLFGRSLIDVSCKS